ncbi:MAG: PfkB family carbohydrate kinase, partial [Clostridia bacterium]|nr:PfkB family carbohydrate kinase [Clostridia bacterium]
MSKIVCFGEVMMRLTPPGYLRLGQSNVLEMTFGGAEANVAVSLANYGQDVSYVTCVPDNPLADACLAQLRGFGVDISRVIRGGERLGIYFVEKGASMRPSKVIYDRKHASIAAVRPGDIDWDRAF